MHFLATFLQVNMPYTQAEGDSAHFKESCHHCWIQTRLERSRLFVFDHIWKAYIDRDPCRFLRTPTIPLFSCRHRNVARRVTCRLACGIVGQIWALYFGGMCRSHSGTWKFPLVRKDSVLSHCRKRRWGQCWTTCPGAGWRAATKKLDGKVSTMLDPLFPLFLSDLFLKRFCRNSPQVACLITEVLIFFLGCFVLTTKSWENVLLVSCRCKRTRPLDACCCIASITLSILCFYCTFSCADCDQLAVAKLAHLWK